MKTAQMKKIGAFVAGMGSAFALFPTGQLDQFVAQPSIAKRLNSNFSRVGENLRRAQGRIRDEQAAKKAST